MTALAGAGPWFGAFFVIALVAFWPSYLSRVSTQNAYTHAHALTAALWMLLLVSQPMAIRARRLAWHRAAGQASYLLAPLVLAAMVLLAHSRLQGLAGEAYRGQTFTLYLQLSLALQWALCYGLAIAFRRRTALHARLMVGTGLTLIDPVVIRFVIWADPPLDWNFQWLTFGLTDLVLLVLIVLERRAPSGRAVFPSVLAGFLLLQAPALLGGWRSPAWQDFARWFAALPLT